ncbi:HDIG domain-containing protein [Pseudodesulfovibrio sp. F-1]|uniref:HDIG domain-containing protein n=1 Tax=Pseudodesulfovibrio alkaliphilus TaxID=2661613 RepID=A0A7K1KJG6_9BACT|nr:HDIG domain-containing metalloprotein [Pseudodesulfovibrio alkaliphilus]MUM76206.1 HDIG domain-containing protein [Pseudodesulfovibrio alkaliphilus]
MNASKTPPASGLDMCSPLPAPPPMVHDPGLPVPDESRCMEHWSAFAMLENVAAHSLVVARVATFLAVRAREMGMAVDVPTVRASALLHDIAKSYCIRHGGNHSQLGGAWTVALTGNPAIATGVTHHVYWPFALNLADYFTPLAVIYADKRVRHDTLVSIESRFRDLGDRYGVSEPIRQRIEITRVQAVELETLLCDTLEVDLNECAFDCGRVV